MISFNQHMSQLCSKAAKQVNARCRLTKFMRNNEKIAMINSFFYSNFNCSLLAWHFYACKSSQKIEKFKNVAKRLVLHDYESDYGNLVRKNGAPQWKLRVYEI